MINRDSYIFLPAVIADFTRKFKRGGWQLNDSDAKKVSNWREPVLSRSMAEMCFFLLQDAMYHSGRVSGWRSCLGSRLTERYPLLCRCSSQMPREIACDCTTQPRFWVYPEPSKSSKHLRFMVSLLLITLAAVVFCNRTSVLRCSRVPARRLKMPTGMNMLAEEKKKFTSYGRILIGCRFGTPWVTNPLAIRGRDQHMDQLFK